MKKVFSLSAVIIGCVVGAGFASGRELLVFFDGANPYAASASFFVLFFAVSCLFLHNSRSLRPDGMTDLNARIFGRFSPIFDAVFLLNYFLAVATMIAGCRTVFQKVSGASFPAGLIVALLCAFAVWRGLDGIKKINAVLVPVIICLIVCVAASSADGGAAAEVDFSVMFGSAKYVAYNAMLMCGLLTACGKTLDKKQSVWAAFIASAVLAAMILLVLLCFAGKNFIGVEMPLLYLAKQGKVYFLFAAAVFCGIITSLLAAAFPVVEWGEKKLGDRAVAVAAVFVSAYAVSLFGFADILDFTLPITSLAALAFTVCSAASAFGRKVK